MKKLLLLLTVALALTGCVAVPVYDSGYYHSNYPYYYPGYYGPYPYGYWGPDVNLFFGFHGGHGFHSGHGFHGGHGFSR